jgi:hypothetical protein
LVWTLTKKTIADYTKIFATGSLMSACHRWNGKESADKIWTNFKIHLAAAHHQHEQIQGESAANYGYSDANSAGGQTEHQMVEASFGAQWNSATATVADRGVVVTLTEANAPLARKSEKGSKDVKEVKSLLKKVLAERRGQRPFTSSLYIYFWSHGYKVAKSHTSQSCNFPKDGHKREAKKSNNMDGC